MYDACMSGTIEFCQLVNAAAGGATVAGVHDLWHGLAAKSAYLQ